MFYQEKTPNIILEKYVDRYFFLGKDSDDIETENLIIPDGTYGLLFIENCAIKRYSSDNKSVSDSLNNSYLFGQKSKSVYYLLEEMNTISFGVKLKPLGLRLLTQIPGKELIDGVFDTGEILNYDFADVKDAVCNAATLNQKVDEIEKFFIEKLKRVDEDDNVMLSSILNYVHENAGQISVQQVADKFGIGYKKVERLFNKYVGMNPKTYCRVVRFNSTIYKLRSNPAFSLTQIAYLAGYTDQNHFIKEVKEFTNMTPKEFFTFNNSQLSNKLHEAIAVRFSKLEMVNQIRLR